jgi:hypothetical protein
MDPDYAIFARQMRYIQHWAIGSGALGDVWVCVMQSL